MGRFLLRRPWLSAITLLLVAVRVLVPSASPVPWRSLSQPSATVAPRRREPRYRYHIPREAVRVAIQRKWETT